MLQRKNMTENLSLKLTSKIYFGLFYTVCVVRKGK